MKGDWKEKGRVQNFAPRPEAADFTPQQYSSSRAPGRWHENNGAQVMGSSNTNTNLQPPVNAAQQGYMAKGFRQQPPPTARQMDNFQANANAAASRNAAQQLTQSKDLARHRPQPADKFHANNSQHVSMLQANTYTSLSSRDPLRLTPNQNNRTNLQANTFIPTGQGQRRTMPKSMYQKGVIIRAIHFEEDFESGSGKSFRGPNAAADMAKTLTRTVTGEWLYSKYRKFIVVGLQTERYVAVPLYTHNGEGLTGSHINPDEHVSVQDHWAAPIVPLSRHAPVKTLQLENHVRQYHDKSTAHLGDPVAKRYCHPVVYEGRLDEDSTRHIVKLWQYRMSL